MCNDGDIINLLQYAPGGDETGYAGASHWRNNL